MLLSIICLINKNKFSFSFQTSGLDIFYNGNLFSHATLKEDFIVLDLDNTYDNISSVFISYFNSSSKSAK